MFIFGIVLFDAESNNSLPGFFCLIKMMFSLYNSVIFANVFNKRWKSIVFNCWWLFFRPNCISNFYFSYLYICIIESLNVSPIFYLWWFGILIRKLYFNMWKLWIKCYLKISLTTVQMIYLVWMIEVHKYYKCWLILI